MSYDIDDNRVSNDDNDSKGKDIFRYTHEQMVDFFKAFPHPPVKLIPFCQIISPNGPQQPVSRQPMSDLEKISYYKGINSYQALLEKWGKSQRGRGFGRARRGRWNYDKRYPGTQVFNGVGPPSKWEQNSGNWRRNMEGPPPRQWSRGRVWVRGGGRGCHPQNTVLPSGFGRGGPIPSQELSNSPPDGRISPTDLPEHMYRDQDVEEIWEEDDWDLELIGDTPDDESHDLEWSRILSHASLYDLRSPGLGGANSPAAWSECPLPSDSSPPRSLSLDPPVLHRLVRLELQRSPSQNNIDPDVLQEMVENVITQLPIAQDPSPLVPSRALELTEEKRRLEAQLAERNDLLRQHKDRLRLKEEELEAVRRQHLRAWDNGPPHRRNRPQSLAEIQWEQAAEDGFPVACYRPVSSSGAGGRPPRLSSRPMGLSHASSQVSLTETSAPLQRHSSMDVLNQREDQGWTARKGRRRRIYRRVDLHTLNGLLTTTP